MAPRVRIPRKLQSPVHACLLSCDVPPVNFAHQEFIEVGKDVSDKIEAVIDFLQGEQRAFPVRETYERGNRSVRFTFKEVLVYTFAGFSLVKSRVRMTHDQFQNPPTFLDQMFQRTR